MKIQGNESIVFPGGNDAAAVEQNPIFTKIRNETQKKFYESKINSLADHNKLTLHLLRMMCQDVPVKSDNLESPWGRKFFVRKCIRYYAGKLKDIERSERSVFFRFFS